MSLDDDVRKAIRENPELSRFAEQDPMIREELYGIMAKKYDENYHIVQGGKWLDKTKRWTNLVKLSFDTVLGPILGYVPRGIADVVEMGLEIPYMAYYLAKTKCKHTNAKAWATRAALQYLPAILPIPGIPGDLAGMIPLYERSAKRYIRKSAADEMVNRLRTRNVIPLKKGRAKDLEEAIDEVYLHPEIEQGFDGKVVGNKLYLTLPDSMYRAKFIKSDAGNFYLHIYRKKGTAKETDHPLEVEIPKGVGRIVPSSYMEQDTGKKVS